MIRPEVVQEVKDRLDALVSDDPAGFVDYAAQVWPALTDAEQREIDAWMEVRGAEEFRRGEEALDGALQDVEPETRRGVFAAAYRASDVLRRAYDAALRRLGGEG